MWDLIYNLLQEMRFQEDQDFFADSEKEFFIVLFFEQNEAP
jgi:hypothetical protein